VENYVETVEKYPFNVSRPLHLCYLNVSGSCDYGYLNVSGPCDYGYLNLSRPLHLCYLNVSGPCDLCLHCISTRQICQPPRSQIPTDTS